MATINRRGRTWQLNWSDAEGQHRVSLGAISAKDARIALERKKLELLTGIPAFSGATFGQFAVDYLAWHSQQYPSTYPRVEGIVRLHLWQFANVPLMGITPVAANAWVARRLTEVKPATVTKEARVLAAILNKAVKWRVIQENPLLGWSPPPERASKPVEFYTTEQLAALYLASGEWGPVWQFMANTGLRRNEALNLNLTEVFEDRVRVLSTEDAPTKSRRWREVPLNSKAQAAVEALRGKRKEGRLLPRVLPRSLTRAFEKATRRAGLTGSLHTLRHTFVSHLVMAGVDLTTVKDLAGHATIQTTLKYAHLSPLHRVSAVEKIAL